MLPLYRSPWLQEQLKARFIDKDCSKIRYPRELVNLKHRQLAYALAIWLMHFTFLTAESN
jgi:hypothetical protein